MIIKTFKILRNNWKKTVFFAGVVGFGSNYLHTSYKINCLMREYCEEALKLGGEQLRVFSQPKHITVILNPRSKKSKSRKQFNDFVAPILHCAGYKVSLVETENQGQAVQLMEVMSNTDAVLIAGGSGTIQEAITGFLRREDADQVGCSLPIAFLPLGTNNRTFNRIYDFSHLNNIRQDRLKEVKILAESAMKILKDKRVQLNVTRIHDLESSKAVFSLNRFEFGVLNELARKFKNHWYLGDKLAAYYVFLRATLFKKLDTFELGNEFIVNYTESCSGCSNCYKEFISKDKSNQRSGGWFSMFRSMDQKKSDNSVRIYENKLKNTVNSECGKWKTMKIDKLMNVQIENDPRNDVPELKLRILKNSNDLVKSKFLSFLKIYPEHEDDKGTNNLELKVRDLKLDLLELDVDDSIKKNESEAIEKEQNDDAKADLKSDAKADATKADATKTDATKTEDNKNKLNFFIDDENYDIKRKLEFNSKLNRILTYN